MLAILAFEVTVYRHQEYYRGRNNLTAPVSKTIFHDITRHHLDDGIINCAKYFINYFFYKFGLEVSFLVGVFSIFCGSSNSCFGQLATGVSSCTSRPWLLILGISRRRCYWRAHLAWLKVFQHHVPMAPGTSELCLPGSLSSYSPWCLSLVIVTGSL